MKYKSLKFNNEIIVNQKHIEKILLEHNFYWLVESEFENAELEIVKKTIIWHNGIWYNGNWVYGIWKNGKKQFMKY